MAGTGLYWGHGEEELRALAEALGIPVFLNGLGRGCLPADHELAFSRARGAALKGADVALVDRRADGLPARLRRQLRRGDEDRPARRRPERADRQPRARGRPGRRRRGTLAAIREAAAAGAAHGAWLEELRAVEAEKRAAEQEELNDARSPLHPVRVYSELGEVLDRDAIVVGDGGDFVSYAGRFIETYEPGCWMDPGPFGCLGAGPGPGDRRQGRPSRPAGLPAARRWRLRLRRDGVRHDGASRSRCGRRDGQQRDLGA